MDFLEQFKELNRPNVSKKPWMDGVDLRLATRSDLETITEECIKSGRFGLDLETTGLDTRTYVMDDGSKTTYDKIVGFCLAPSVTKGWYIPVRHKEGGSEHNVPVRLVKEMIEKIQAGKAKAVFHNAKFDQKLLNFDPVGRIGDWESQDSWDDTIILTYLRDSRQKRKGLKFLAESELGRQMIELEELFSPEVVKSKKLDFSTLDPSWPAVVWYAAPDAINTLALYYKLCDSVIQRDEFGLSQATVYKLEKACLTATMWMEDCQIYIDRKKLESLIKLGQQEWWDCISEVYNDAGSILGRDVRTEWFRVMQKTFNPESVDPVYTEVRNEIISSTQEPNHPAIKKNVPKVGQPKEKESVDFPHSYDVTNPPELGLMMREMGIEGLVATEKTGQVKTDQDTLDQVIEEAGDKYPFMKKIKRLREVAKGLTSYLFAIYWDSAPDRSPEGRVMASFDGFKVDTGRFATATPKEKDRHKFSGQCRWMVHGTPASYDKSKPACVRRIREVVAARKGWTVVAMDYSGVELRIVSNISGEKKWLDEFFHCSDCDKFFPKDQRPPPFCPDCGSDKIGDIHSLTAISIFGEEVRADPKEFKLKRNQSKGVNFGMCYGGGPSAVQRAVGTDWDESCRIKNKFDSTYKTLQSWWKRQHTMARKQKYVVTAFGRKYPVPDIDHEFGSFRSKAERNSVNGPVQGTSADIMKLAMVLIYKEMKKRGWLDLVRMEITIHDELVFEIHNSVIGEAVDVIEKIMVEDTVRNLNWVVPLKVDIEFGRDWTVPYNLSEMTYNKGGGKWDRDLASIFPRRYSSYLENGGEQVSDEPGPSGVSGPEGGSSAPTGVVNTSRPEPLKVPKQQGDDRVFSFSIPDVGLSSENAEKLCRIMRSCYGLGVDRVFIKFEDGSLMFEEPIITSFAKFFTLAEYEGIPHA